MKDIKLGRHIIGHGHGPFLIAGLSGNHSQNFELAKSMVDAAAKAGADAIKLQTYTADSMTLNVETSDFVIQEEDSLWHGEALHALYAKAATPYEWHTLLFEYVNGLGMLAFRSPFDEDCGGLFRNLECPLL